MRSHTMLMTLLSLAAFGACASDDDGTGSQTSEVTGAMRYQDATTNSDGSPRDAASVPADQSVTVTVEVRGTGVITGVEASCTLDGATGQFRALFDGTANVDENGAYVAGFGSGSARIETLSGCAIPELTVNAITDVVVRAEIAATTQSCETYCAASARSDAEAECAGSSSEAECRAAAEASATASCTTECTSQRDVIVAEASLAASLLGDLDADALRAAAFGDFAADLTFDHME
jgi:hypothetical protein